MRMMGMTDFAYWFSWILYYTIVNTVLATLVFSVLMMNVMDRGSAKYIYLFVWLYGESLFGLLVITQALFSSPRSAAITTTLIYFGTSIISSLVGDEEIPRKTKVGASVLFPTVSMILGT
jgi:uncharacterized membrane protein YdcZ (DUF606 family)